MAAFSVKHQIVKVWGVLLKVSNSMQRSPVWLFLIPECTTHFKVTKYKIVADINNSRNVSKNVKSKFVVVKQNASFCAYTVAIPARGVDSPPLIRTANCVWDIQCCL